MTPTEELIADLKAAILNKEQHNQKVFFNECGTAACIAGQKLERDIHNKVITSHSYRDINCWNYSRVAYNLNIDMADLIFNEHANYISHQLAILILERGLTNMLTYCNYINDDIEDDAESMHNYSNTYFALVISLVNETAFKLFADIAKEIGANLHRRDSSNQFLIEKGVEFTLNDINTFFNYGDP